MNPETIAALLRGIEAIRAACGDDDIDETLRADMIEGETDYYRVLSRLLRAYNAACADEAGAKAAKAEFVSRYDTRIKSAERRKAAIKEMAATVIRAAGKAKERLPEGSLSISTGRKSLRLDDDFKPPQGYQKIEPDNAAIKAALEAGAEIPGASLVIGDDIVTIRA